MNTINYLAVFVGAVASLIIGGLWYGPLFGDTWMNLLGLSKESMQSSEKKNIAQRGYAISLLSSLVMAYTLALFSNIFRVTDITGAWQLSFWVWLGFVATTQLGPVLWLGKSFKLYLIDTVYYLVNIFVISIILVLL